MTGTKTATLPQLIARHLARMRERDPVRAREVLLSCQLELEGDHVVKLDGVPIGEEDCYRYKEAIRRSFGEACYAGARINFVLGGCDCRACRSFRTSLVTGVDQ